MISPITREYKESGSTGQQDTAEPPSGGGRSRRKSKRGRLTFLRQDIVLLLNYVAHYVAARTDAVTVKIRRAVIWMIVGVVALLAAAAAVITAVVLLLNGIADALTVVFGNRAWAGNLTVGASILVLIALLIYGGMVVVSKKSYREIKDKYERRRKDEHVLDRRSESDRKEP